MSYNIFLQGGQLKIFLIYSFLGIECWWILKLNCLQSNTVIRLPCLLWGAHSFLISQTCVDLCSKHCRLEYGRGSAWEPIYYLLVGFGQVTGALWVLASVFQNEVTTRLPWSSEPSYFYSICFSLVLPHYLSKGRPSEHLWSPGFPRNWQGKDILFQLQIGVFIFFKGNSSCAQLLFREHAQHGTSEVAAFLPPIPVGTVSVSVDSCRKVYLCGKVWLVRRVNLKETFGWLRLGGNLVIFSKRSFFRLSWGSLLSWQALPKVSLLELWTWYRSCRGRRKHPPKASRSVGYSEKKKEKVPEAKYSAWDDQGRRPHQKAPNNFYTTGTFTAERAGGKWVSRWKAHKIHTGVKCGSFAPYLETKRHNPPSKAAAIGRQQQQLVPCFMALPMLRGGKGGGKGFPGQPGDGCCGLDASSEPGLCLGQPPGKAQGPFLRSRGLNE